MVGRRHQIPLAERDYDTLPSSERRRELDLRTGQIYPKVQARVLLNASNRSVRPALWYQTLRRDSLLTRTSGRDVTHT